MTAIEHENLRLHMDVVFRIASKEDIPRLEWNGQYSHFRMLFRRAYREQLNGRRLMLLADLDGFPIGHIFIQFHSLNTRVADGTKRAYLYSFRVMELFQGQGLGTKIMHEAERRLIRRGFTVATIAVAKDNRGALRLYERLGYTCFAEDPGTWSYVDHQGNHQQVEEPCWLLQKTLKPDLA